MDILGKPVSGKQTQAKNYGTDELWDIILKGFSGARAP